MKCIIQRESKHSAYGKKGIADTVTFKYIRWKKQYKKI